MRRVARRHALDLLVVIAALQGAIAVAVSDSLREPDTPAWLAAAAVTLVTVPLLARRRFESAAPALVWVLAASFSFLDGRMIADTVGIFAAGMAAALLLGNLRDGGQARLGLAIVVGGAVVIVTNKPEYALDNVLFTPVVFGIAWLAGYVLRERSAQAEAAEERADYAEREREAAARVAVAEERARIAREMHDVVAHAISVMVLQVGAVRHRLPPALEDDRHALQAVEQAGRTALAEMRQMLGAMRDDHEAAEMAPQPGLDRLAALVEDVRRAGLDVQLRVEGEPVDLPRALDLSAYRIVQEGLTNTLKHAGARQASVAVGYDPGELRIEVRDDGGGAPAGDGLGHGLVGVRERVKIHGGEMTAGPAGGGGFVLRTRLPLGGYGR